MPYLTRTQQIEASAVTPTWRDRIPGGNVDRRRSPRFRLRLPVLTQWTDDEGHVRYGGGFSRDIGIRGVFVLSSEPPSSSTMISVTVVLPNLRVDLQDLHLRCVGSLVRVEKDAAVGGYAIECDFRGIEEILK